MLRDFEHNLINGSSATNLLEGFTINLSLNQLDSNRQASLERLHKIVTHFYLVSFLKFYSVFKSVPINELNLAKNSFIIQFFWFCKVSKRNFA